MVLRTKVNSLDGMLPFNEQFQESKSGRLKFSSSISLAAENQLHN